MTISHRLDIAPLVDVASVPTWLIVLIAAVAVAAVGLVLWTVRKNRKK